MISLGCILVYTSSSTHLISASTHRRGIRVWRFGEGSVRNGVSLQAAENSIYIAAKKGDVDCLKDIIVRCNDGTHRNHMLEWTDSMGRTPLIMAIVNGHFHCAEALVKAGANVDHMSREQFGGSALHSAFYNHRSRKFVNLLLSRGADPFLENTAGYTPWDVCRQNRRPEISEFSKKAIFESRFDIKDKASFVSSTLSRCILFHIFILYNISPHGSNSKQASGLRLYAYKRKASNTFYDIDLEGCEAQIVSNAKNKALIRLTCPIHCIEEWKELTPTNGYDESFKELYIQGSGDCAQAFVDIVNQHHANERLDDADDDCYNDDDDETPTEILESSTSELSSLSSSTNINNNSTVDHIHVEEPCQCQHGDEGHTNNAVSQSCDEEREAAENVQSGCDPHKEDSRCVICLEGRRTVGFVHRESMHVCVCEDCASKFTKGSSQCPLCRQPIQHIVKRIYT